MLRAALVCLGLFVGAGGAWAAAGSVLVKSDTLALYAADSSAVINVENCARLWLDIFVVPLRRGDVADRDTTGLASYHGHSATAADVEAFQVATIDSLNAKMDSSFVDLAVQAREVLSRAAGLDTSGVERGGADNYVPAASSDTTVIAWLPRFPVNQTSATTDTFTINNIAPGNVSPGSSEISVVVQPRMSPWGTRRVRVDFVNAHSGAPFRAQFASFRWRLTDITYYGGQAPIGFLTLARFRVVLGRETW